MTPMLLMSFRTKTKVIHRSSVFVEKKVPSSTLWDNPQELSEKEEIQGKNDEENSRST